jgi:inner membrane protein
MSWPYHTIYCLCLILVRMIARTHDLAAITLLAAVVLTDPPQSVTVATAATAIIANQIGGIAPDIDQPTAPFWRNLPIGGIFGRLIGRTLGGHRFLSHSLLGLALFGFLANLLLNILHPIMPKVDTDLVWWAFMIGMVSHLIMDSLTKEGVPWLLPIPFKFGFPPLRQLRITTGKKVEHFIVLPVLIVIAVWLFASHYGEITSIVDHFRR